MKKLLTLTLLFISIAALAQPNRRIPIRSLQQSPDSLMFPIGILPNGAGFDQVYDYINNYRTTINLIPVTEAPTATGNTTIDQFVTTLNGDIYYIGVDSNAIQIFDSSLGGGEQDTTEFRTVSGQIKTNSTTLDVGRVGNVSIGSFDNNGKLSIANTTDTFQIHLKDIIGQTQPQIFGTTSTGSENFRLHIDSRQNLFIGKEAGKNNTYIDNPAPAHDGGELNTFIGTVCGIANTEGYANTFLGRSSGFNNTLGNTNTFLGHQSGFQNTDGNSNTFIGNDAGSSNEDGNYNTIIGHHAGSSFLKTSSSGNNLIAGAFAAQEMEDIMDNVILGYNAGFNMTDGDFNVLIGRSAGFSSNTSGSVFVGHETGLSCANGLNNTFVGYRSGRLNDEDYNAAFGYNSSATNVNGARNTFMGSFAGFLSTGSDNTALGHNAGYRAGSGNLMIGYRAGEQETGDNKFYLDNSNTTTPLLYGEFDNNRVRMNSSLEVLTMPVDNNLDEVVVRDPITQQLKIRDASTFGSPVNARQALRIINESGTDWVELGADTRTGRIPITGGRYIGQTDENSFIEVFTDVTAGTDQRPIRITSSNAEGDIAGYGLESLPTGASGAFGISSSNIRLRSDGPEPIIVDVNGQNVQANYNDRLELIQPLVFHERDISTITIANNRFGLAVGDGTNGSIDNELYAVDQDENLIPLTIENHWMQITDYGIGISNGLSDAAWVVPPSRDFWRIIAVEFTFSDAGNSATDLSLNIDGSTIPVFDVTLPATQREVRVDFPLGYPISSGAVIRSEVVSVINVPPNTMNMNLILAR